MGFSNSCVLSIVVKHGFSPCARYFLYALNLVVYASFCNFNNVFQRSNDVISKFTTEKTTYIYVQSLYIYSNQSITCN